MKTKRKLLSILMTLAMVVVMAPTRQTVYAFEAVLASTINSQLPGDYEYYSITSTSEGRALKLKTDVNLHLDEDLQLAFISGQNYNMIIDGDHTHGGVKILVSKGGTAESRKTWKKQISNSFLFINSPIKQSKHSKAQDLSFCVLLCS